MQKEAQVYEQEGNDPQTYLLLFRHALLVLDRLAKHPEANDERTRAALRAAQATVNSDLAKMEVLKPRINRRHEEYLERRRAQQKALQALEGRGTSTSALASELGKISLDRGNASQRRSYEKTTLDAGQNRTLAAKLAQREIKRRDAARRTVRQAGVSEEEEQERRTGGLWGNWEKDLDWRDDDLSKQIQQVGHQRESIQNGRNSTYSSHPTTQPHQTYHYPSILHHTANNLPSSRTSRTSTDGLPPALPRKEPLPSSSHYSSQIPPALPPKPPRPPKPQSVPNIPLPPPVPGKYPDPHTSAPSSLSTPTPELDGQEFTFKPSAYLENGTPLRTVFLPPDLRHQFLQYALPNTRRNLETCGILCGILKSNALFISQLVIPEQKSTSDTCETLNEQAYFDHCDKEDLMVLGWIHTHPSQTCFMSSRDLHTHCGYQVMMPESIAIVCAPSKEPSWGVFRLTDPPGMKTVLNCTKPGLFHPHDVDNIYTDALKPGHVFELPNMPFDVVDLRP